MGRSNQDFYHGTDHNFYPGEQVVPGKDNLAWAATNRDVAAQYGKNVYRVEPIADVTRHRGAAKEFGIHYSSTGYNVVDKSE